MKKILSVIHLFPREVDDFDYLISQLKVASSFLGDTLSIDFNIVLNFNPKIINWENSKLPKDFFIQKVKSSIKKLDWANQINLEIIEDDSVCGLLEQRISLTKKFPDYYGYLILDNDIILDDLCFYGLENAINSITETTSFVITPQPYSHWDSSWDVISYVPFEQTFNIDEFNSYSIKSMFKDEIQIVESSAFKFAGGWFTFITKDLLSTISFPDVKGYGMEDTYLSFCFNRMKSSGQNVKQFILKNILIQENRKYLSNSIYVDFVPYDMDYLKPINEHSKKILWDEIVRLSNERT